MPHVLIVEDDPTINANIKAAFLAESYAVDVAFDGQIAEKFMRKNKYECLIIDINLPYKNGCDLCKIFRTFNQNTPILLLTAFDELEDKVQGFDSGADDYLTKPFFMKELLLRVQALIKRSNRLATDDDELYSFEDLNLIPSQRKVLRNNIELVLTPREYEIIYKLLKAKGEFVTKKELMKEVWGTTSDANTNKVEVYINFLRNKVDKPFNKKLIKTKVGFGYYLSSEE